MNLFPELCTKIYYLEQNLEVLEESLRCSEESFLIESSKNPRSFHSINSKLQIGLVRSDIGIQKDDVDEIKRGVTTLRETMVLLKGVDAKLAWAESHRALGRANMHLCGLTHELHYADASYNAFECAIDNYSPDTHSVEVAECYVNGAWSLCVMLQEQIKRSPLLDEQFVSQVKRRANQLADAVNVACHIQDREMYLAALTQAVYLAVLSFNNAENDADSSHYNDVALKAAELALPLLDRNESPEEWSSIQAAISMCCEYLLNNSDSYNEELFLKGIVSARNALTVYTKDNSPHQWAFMHITLTGLYSRRGFLCDDLESMNKAITCVYTAREFYSDDLLEDSPLLKAEMYGMLGYSMGFRSQLNGSSDDHQKACEYYRLAASIFEQHGLMEYLITIQLQLAILLTVGSVKDFEESETRLRKCMRTLDQNSISSNINHAVRFQFVFHLAQTRDRHKVMEGLELIRNVSISFQEDKESWIKYQYAHGQILTVLAELDGNNERKAEAQNVYRVAMKKFSREEDHQGWEFMEEALSLLDNS